MIKCLYIAGHLFVVTPDNVVISLEQIQYVEKGAPMASKPTYVQLTSNNVVIATSPVDFSNQVSDCAEQLEDNMVKEYQQ